ncbi:hypothetical protein [Streptomyces sp. NRRL F-2580]|uniref:hypothetical protein n=1 Tax=Streptomyces sp. NRRL F-2580 TaxID=1463841 RepID=UPI0004C79CFF|nr:hypothetical protein [Streptomyces sp. NRRL F-2580]
MNKAYGVAGAALTGGLTGWLALALWQWADAEDKRSCADSTSVCLTYYPLTGILSWVVLAAVVFAVALPLVGVRPRKAAAAASLALQTCALAVIGPFAPHDAPDTNAPNLIALALGPALVGVCAVPAWRRAGLVAIGVLVVAGLIAVGVDKDMF